MSAPIANVPKVLSRGQAGLLDVVTAGIAASPAADGVLFIDDLEDLYTAMDLYVLASYREGAVVRVCGLVVGGRAPPDRSVVEWLRERFAAYTGPVAELLAGLSDAELRMRTDWLRERLEKGETLDDILPELLLGTLDTPARQAAERHLAGCERCRAEVASLQRQAVARLSVHDAESRNGLAVASLVQAAGIPSGDAGRVSRRACTRHRVSRASTTKDPACSSTRWR